ncbi:peptidylprolyl isomerase [Acanthopleuribacter pedis]|uniref:peptidylprolyl isomerase n=1 Tax=Acanthopleuribacter pedis TaxID=442870 RepID=A0A8J7QJ72_9BACT|nr:peptidylprolyl isomerase [Acanthopleuribacter pedis]MBO1319193.1 peptidylprolyl isomerase [Acanthopleuribacter pedis]
MMTLAFCWLWMQTATQTPIETWSAVMEARFKRHAASIPTNQFNLETQSQLLMQEYLLTIGQNGHPDAAKIIVAHFSHPQLQSTALFAYGELGAPVQPLWNTTVAEENRLFWWEAVAKCASPSDRGELLQRWQAAPPNEQTRSLRTLYRHGHESFNLAVRDLLSRRPTGNNLDPLFYLFRNKVPIHKKVFLTQVANPDNSTRARLFLLRLTVSDADAAVVDALLALTKSADWRLRVNAVNALGNTAAAHGEQPTPFMLAAPGLLGDPNPNVVTATLTQLVQRNDPAIDKWLEPRFGALSQAQKVVILENMEGERKQRHTHLIQGWRKSRHPWPLRQWIIHEGPNQRGELQEWTDPKNKGLATLSYQILTAPENPEHRRWLNAALASKDPYLAATAVTAMGNDRNLSRTYLPRINALLAQPLPEPDFHYAVIDSLEALMPDAARRGRLLQQLQAHPDYLVRLKAFETAGTVDFARRRNLFNRPWNHPLPAQILQQAALFAQGAPEPTWLLQTNRGEIRIKLRGSYAPITCANIVYLSNRKYFDNMPIHRVVPNFVVQAGDSRGDGSGGPGHTIPCEINTLRYKRGTVGMALAGKDTGGSQWFICHSAQPHLDGNYTVFGQVTEGMPLVDRLEEGDIILNTRIIF